MRVTHLCLASFFPDGYAYQENMLPKFHKALGYDVTVIASEETFDENGKPALYVGPSEYLNEYNIPVKRLKYMNPQGFYRKLRRYKGVYRALEESAPDILFIHGCQFLDIDQVVRYLKNNRGVRVYVDNHADFSNSATNWLSKEILHQVVWKHCAHLIEPFTQKFYGVLPARVDFLRDVYGLPKEKCELLVMGADDEMVQKVKSEDARLTVRKKYGIEENDFLVVSGGKIDKWKTQTLLLMEAVKNIKSDRLKLIVFGSVTPELKENIEKLSDGKKVQYIGWIKSERSYEFFEAADLVVFPGRHSVMWEQATGQGAPLIVKDWKGTHHVDLGGNVRFLQNDSVQEIQEAIERLYNNIDEYKSMKCVAEKKGMTVFSYKNIAKRSIEV